MKRQWPILSIVGLVLSLAAGARPAWAHTEGACKEDAQKLCADVKPGDGALRDCMKAHEAGLSQACKDNMAEGKEKFKEKRKEMEEACKPDLQKYCANVTPGEGREFACLHSYSDKLSPACKEKMPKGKGMHKGMTPPPPPPPQQ